MLLATAVGTRTLHQFIAMNRPAFALLIALALAAVVGVFFFVRPFLKPPVREEDKPVILAARPYEEVMEKALAGYNAHDAAALFAGFATSAVPAATDATHRALFEGYYQEVFGACRSRRLSPRECEILPGRALLVWDATFSKARAAKLSANFITENDQPKIVQLRMEKVEAEK